MNNFEYGIGIITCDRPVYVTRLIDSVKDACENIYIVNDGDTELAFDNNDVYYLSTEKPKSGVGKAKNIALKQFMSDSYDYFFLLEDDIVIKDLNV